MAAMEWAWAAAMVPAPTIPNPCDGPLAWLAVTPRRSGRGRGDGAGQRDRDGGHLGAEAGIGDGAAGADPVPRHRQAAAGGLDDLRADVAEHRQQGVLSTLAAALVGDVDP